MAHQKIVPIWPNDLTYSAITFILMLKNAYLTNPAAVGDLPTYHCNRNKQLSNDYLGVKSLLIKQQHAV